MIPGLSVWRRWANPRLLLVSIIFGLVGMLTLWAGMRLPIVPSANIAADAREIFVVLAAGLTGPLGGLLAGAIASLYSPSADVGLRFCTWLAHTLAGFSLGLYFRALSLPYRGWRFLFFWLSSVSVYYAVLVGVFTLSASLVSPLFVVALAQPEGIFALGMLRLALSALPEMAFIMAFTATIWMALPLWVRKPL